MKEGTGFFVSRDGLIATNAHVIRGATSLKVATLDGDTYDNVYFVTADGRRDLAIIKIAVDDASPLQLSAIRAPQVGDPIYVMGNPLGQVGTFSNGILSALREMDSVTFLQITAPISPGSSGGPVLGGSGEVVAVATFILRGGENLNFAVPVRYLRPLLSTGDAPQPYQSALVPADQSVAAPARNEVHDEPPPTGTNSGRDYQQEVAGQFVYTDSMLAGVGYSRVGHVLYDTLAADKEARLDLTLVAAHEYIVVGHCDDDCRDLDSYVINQGGTMLAEDHAPDADPLLTFTSRVTGKYTLVVSMHSCSVSPCYYGVALYARH